MVGTDVRNLHTDHKSRYLNAPRGDPDQARPGPDANVQRYCSHPTGGSTTGERTHAIRTYYVPCRTYMYVYAEYGCGSTPCTGPVDSCQD